MSNPPLWGRGTNEAVPGLPEEDGQGGPPPDKKGTRRARRSISRSQARTEQAINDAQQSLHSLLNPQTDRRNTGSTGSAGHPHIISPSGATRSHKRNRVAGPSPAAPDIYSPLQAGWARPIRFQNFEVPVWAPARRTDRSSIRPVSRSRLPWSTSWAITVPASRRTASMPTRHR